MRIAGLIAFWAGLAAFWITTVSLVVAKRDDPTPPSPAITNAKDTNAKDTNAKDTNAKDTNAKDTNAKDIEPSNAQTQTPANQERVTQEKIPSVNDETRASSVTLTASAQPPEANQQEVVDPVVAETPQPMKEPPAPRVANRQPSAEDEPSAPPAETKPETTGPPATRTLLVLHVPEDAQVYLDGYLTRTTGTVREYATTKLQAGTTVSTYTVRVEVVRGGQTLVRERAIRLQAGRRHDVTVEFSSDGVSSTTTDGQRFR